MSAIALIELKTPTGQINVAPWPGSEDPLELPIFFDALDDRTTAPVTP